MSITVGRTGSAGASGAGSSTVTVGSSTFGGAVSCTSSAAFYDIVQSRLRANGTGGAETYLKRR